MKTPDQIRALFNPAKHQTKPDGTPRLNKYGNLLPKGGRKPKKPMTSTNPTTPPNPAPAVTAPATPTPAQFAAEFAGPGEAPPNLAGLEALANGAGPQEAPTVTPAGAVETGIALVQTALVLIGEEEGILTETEKTLLRPPLEDCIKKYNLGGVMPCELSLAVVIATLIINRLQKPKTATTFSKVKAWAIKTWFSWTGRSLAAELREKVGQVDPSAKSAPTP